MKKLKVAVMGLGMGGSWAQAAADLPTTELGLVYDPNYGENPRIDRKFYGDRHIPVVATEEEIYASDADLVVVASPDHFHADQCVRALAAGKHVACEKPLAPTVAECRRIVEAVKASGREFMTGQVCRYAPGFRTAKMLLEQGRIGELVCLESEYAHDYTHVGGYGNWRKDPAIKREGFLGGGCHALDLTRWLAGNPLEVFCYMNHKYLPDWPTSDTGYAVAQFPNQVIGKIFVSIGVKRPYTMRTVIYGTAGTIICDNTSPQIQICEKGVCEASSALRFSEVPVSIASHNVKNELKEFSECILAGRHCPTDVYEGTRTVAFAEAAIRSSASGKAERVCVDF